MNTVPQTFKTIAVSSVLNQILKLAVKGQNLIMEEMKEIF